MPTISRFYGLTVYMYANDHAPPHFHAEYGEFEAMMGIAPIELIAGELPNRARSLAVEWPCFIRRNFSRIGNGVGTGSPLLRFRRSIRIVQ